MNFDTRQTPSVLRRASIFLIALLMFTMFASGAVSQASIANASESVGGQTGNVTLDGTHVFIPVGVSLGATQGAPDFNFATAPDFNFATLGEPIFLGEPANAEEEEGNWFTDMLGWGWERATNLVGEVFDCVTSIGDIGDTGIGGWGVNCFSGVAGSILGTVGDVLQTVGSFAMIAILKIINGAVRGLALWWVEFVISGVLGGGDEATTEATDHQHGVGAPVLTTQFFSSQYNIAQSLAFYLLVPLFMLVVIQSIAKGSLFFLIRAATIMLPVSILGSYFVVEFARRLLWISDDLSQAIASNMIDGGNAAEQYSRILDGYSDDMFGLFELFWLLAAGIGGIAIWIELLFRQMGVYLAAFFLPLAFAGLVWPSTAKFARRMVELLIGLIFSKVVIVATLSLGLTSMGFPNEATTEAAAAGTQAQAQAQGLSAGALQSGPTPLVNPAADPSLSGTQPVIADVVANGEPVPVDPTQVTTGSIAADGTPIKGGGINAMIAGIILTWFAAFMVMKLMDWMPGMDHLPSSRLGSAGNIVNKGHVLAFTAERANAMFRRKHDEIAPHGATPKNTKGAPPTGGATGTALALTGPKNGPGGGTKGLAPPPIRPQSTSGRSGRAPGSGPSPLGSAAATKPGSNYNNGKAVGAAQNPPTGSASSPEPGGSAKNNSARGADGSKGGPAGGGHPKGSNNPKGI